MIPLYPAINVTLYGSPGAPPRIMLDIWGRLPAEEALKWNNYVFENNLSSDWGYKQEDNWRQFRRDCKVAIEGVLGARRYTAYTCTLSGMVDTLTWVDPPFKR